MNILQIRIAASLLLLVLFLSGPVNAASQKKQYTLTGKTMGTFYSVKFISKDKTSLPVWEKRINIQLSEINRSMSMFDPKSELSTFNRQPPEKPMTVSNSFFSILLTSRELFEHSEGAWDGTVKPLVDLWGFGTKKTTRRVPDPEKIKSALAETGFNHIDTQAPNLVKKKRSVTLDLGSIAKGYGVDKLVLLFNSFGITDVLAEIGGELRASGRNLKGEPWRVGISKPDKSRANQSLHTVISLDNQSIATSGDYRNFFKKDGKTYSHIIDPRTGQPVNTHIVSASVVTESCTLADGLATALMVMELQKGLALVNRLDHTECLIITHKNGRFENHYSKEFKQLTRP